MCLTDVYRSKQTGSSSTKGNHHPSFLRFWNWAEENCRCSQNLWRRRNVVKTENPANIRKWIAWFYYFRHLYPLEAVLSTIIAWVAHRYGQLYLHCSLTYLGSFQLFLHSDQLSEGEIIPFSVRQSGEAALSTPEAGGGFTHWLTDCFDVQPMTTSGTFTTQSTSALALANSFVYFVSSAATSRWRTSACHNQCVRQLQVLWHFCRAGLCRQWRYHGND